MKKQSKPSIKIQKALSASAPKPVTKASKPVAQDPTKTYCWVSGKVIPPARIKALIMLGVPPHEMTCVEHSQVKKKQGVYLGEYGTSQMLVVDKVYDDSVRDVFNHSQADQHDSDDSDDTEQPVIPQVDEKVSSTYKAIQNEESEE